MYFINDIEKYLNGNETINQQYGYNIGNYTKKFKIFDIEIDLKICFKHELKYHTSKDADSSDNIRKNEYVSRIESRNISDGILKAIL